MLDITLWDENALRLQECYANLRESLMVNNMKANITCQSEPPLLSRAGLLGTGPTVEIDGDYWRCKVGETISQQSFTKLLRLINKK